MSTPTFKLPDTGQVHCYDRDGRVITPTFEDTYYGQDGSFSIYPMAFQKLDEHGAKIEDSAFWSNGYRALLDENTGLIWEVKSPNESDSNYYKDKYSFEELPDKYIERLNKENYAGRSDWRIPNRDELKSIINYDKENPALDPWYFPYGTNGLYWTSFPYAMQPYFAYVVSMGLGSATAISKKTRLPIRAVAGGYHPLFGTPNRERFVDNGDGTITDKVVGLMWQKGENPRMNWYDALEAVKEFTLAGYKDWRLPNIKELNTILDLDYGDGWWYFKEFFPAEGLEPPLLHYFSSTSFLNTYAWVTNFCYGYDGYYANKNTPLLFRAVRNIAVPDKEENLFALPSTGQNCRVDDEGNPLPELTKSDPFYGQDACYNLNPLSYQKFQDRGQKVRKETTWEEGFQMVKDNHTGLIWEIKSSSPLAMNYYKECYNWDEAHHFIAKLNRMNYGGFNDWRLPGKEELRGIVDYSKEDLTIQEDFFPDTIPQFYWSSDRYGADPKLIWGIYFGYGCGIAYLKDLFFPVRAVRGGFQTDFGKKERYDFLDNGDGTITDRNTHLMWKKDESPPLTWRDALATCESLDLAGYHDWRLPNQKELATILDLSYKGNTWFHEDFFPNTVTKPTGFYLSSSTFIDTFAWGVNFQFGYDGYYGDKKHGKYNFRPVRTSLP